MYNHINPYLKHGNKTEHIRKMTVSVPIEIYNTIQEERQRRIENKMRHATASELLCEAFAHAFTGQPLPTDEELIRYISKAKLEKYEILRKKAKEENINLANIVAGSYIGDYQNFKNTFDHLFNENKKPSEQLVHLFHLFNLFATYIITETMSPYALKNEAARIRSSIDAVNRLPNFVDFIKYNIEFNNVLIATDILKLLVNLKDQNPNNTEIE